MAAKKEVSQAKLTTLLSTPKTIAEIKSSFNKLDSSKKVLAHGVSKGFNLFEQRNDIGEPIFVAVPEEVHPARQERVWSMWRKPGKQPWIWVQMPDNLPFKEIKIVPLSDVHYGAEAHNLKRFKEYIEFIRKNDNVFTFLNGDITENAIDGSIGGASYESIMTPSEQLWGHPGDPRKEGIIALLRPIAHKILWAQPGNHEWRTWKKTNIDPTRIYCEALGVPYFSEPVFADILAWGKRFTFYAHHGVSGSQTKGGKINNARKPAKFQTPVNFIVMGHVHDSMASVESVHVPVRTFDDGGKVIEHYLDEVTRYTIICPSFHGYFGSYGARAGYSPGSWGAVSCMLYADGNYRSSK